MSATALARYARLEAPGRYFDGERAAPREVVVSFGARSLVMMGYDGVAIDHWPLGALRAAGAKGQEPLQVMPHGGSEARLVVDEPEMIEAIEAVCPDLHARPATRRGIGRALLAGIAALGAVAILVTAILPALSERLALLIPPERERELGDAVVGQIRDLLALGGDPSAFCTAGPGQAALAEMTDRLRRHAELPYPLRVAVIDHPLVNAVAVPGGRVLLFEGLIDAAESPEEVAGVLAHEIGHVVHRDPTVHALRAAGSAGILGLLVGDVFGAAVVVAATEAVLNARYRREAEARADATALRILAEAGLPSDPFAGFFRRLQAEHGAPRGVLRYLASHPALEGRAERAAEADAVGDAPFDPVLSDGAWVALRGICAETGPDPLSPR